MGYSKIKSYAKINLALNVVGKQSSLHKIESIISFLDLHDEILIKSIKNKNHKIKFIGKFSNNISLNNTVSRLLEIIDKKKLLKHAKFEIIIKKNIPLQAGFGGGSMNAAAILKFLIKKNIFILAVKPSFGCSTKKIYSKVTKFRKARFNKPTKSMFNLDFLKKMNNDLELIALNKYQKLNTLKFFLDELSKVEFVRMTGSGSAIIAYFKTYKLCKEAEKKVKKEFKNYWCKTAKTI